MLEHIPSPNPPLPSRKVKKTKKINRKEKESCGNICEYKI
jgi:hypothetical protein